MGNNNIPGGTLRITLANASQYVIIVLFYMILTKTNALTQTDIGTLSILSFLFSAFSMITVVSLPTALTKFTSEKLGKNQKEEANATQKTITKTVTILSLIGLITAVFLSQPISQHLWNNTEFTIVVILNFIFAFFENIIRLFRSIFRALYLFGKMATLTITFVITNRIVGMLLALLKMGVTGVIIGYIIGSIVTIFVAIKFLRVPIRLPKTTKNMPLKPLLSYSIPLFLIAMTNLILQWADIVIITSISGDLSTTGIYSIAVHSVQFLTILYLPMMTTIFPALSKHHGLEKPESISNILKITSRIIIYVLIPCCIGLAIIAPTALSFFYNPSYAKGAIPLAILSITTILIALNALFSTAFNAIGKTKQILMINIFAAISLILMLLPLVLFLETIGAAIAHLIARTMILALAVYMLGKHIKIRLDKEALWKSIVSTMAFVPFLLTIEFMLSTKLTIIQTLALEIPTAAGIYTLSLYSLKALRAQDFRLLKEALPKSLTKYITKIEHLIVR